jgi:hypothetical protein
VPGTGGVSVIGCLVSLASQVHYNQGYPSILLDLQTNMSSKSEYALVLATPAQRSVVQYGYGRTLNGYVTTVASVLQRTADSVARRYNWGPEETTKEILSILRQEDRKLVLDKLRDAASNQCFPTLAKNCQQLMKYALP